MNLLVLQIRTDVEEGVIRAFLAKPDSAAERRLLSTLDLELARKDRSLFEAWKNGLSGWLMNVYREAGVPVERMVDVDPDQMERPS